ncbi:MAG: trehalase family glycosidase, partial [Microcoleus sp.]
MSQIIPTQKVIKAIGHLSKTATGVGATILPPKRSPDQQLGELFSDVQMSRVNEDGKTFVDAIPNQASRKILKAYKSAHENPDFDLKKFVHEHFTDFTDAAGYHSDARRTPYTHIENLWPILTRHTPRNSGSLLALPHPYVIPGGRYQEQFYWDSYFIMLGLTSSKHYDLVDAMMKNYTYMIRKIGYIPSANRTYLLSRSQPPFFSHMVDLLAVRQGKRAYIHYLPYLLKEYQFWMQGSLRLSHRYTAHRRAVRMPDGTVLNRYYDDRDTPRPESYYEDIETAKAADADDKQVYRDLRAAAESGWDFSSRWLRDGLSLETIHTTDIVPVDLNCLLYDLEMTIAKTYSILLQPILATVFRRKAHKRAEALLRASDHQHPVGGV